MSEDILYRLREVGDNSNMRFTEEIFKRSLIEIQKLLEKLGQKTLSDFGLPLPQNQFGIVRSEEEYNLEELNRYVQEYECQLTQEQSAVYNEILNSISSHSGGLFFLDAPGGTGKTFLIYLVLQKVRTVSCGIAATLLQGGKTAHLTFKLPLNLNYQDQPVCNIKRGFNLSNQLQNCALIVWDECTMSNKAAVEAVDKSLRDIVGRNIPMAGITVLFSGDFR